MTINHLQLTEDRYILSGKVIHGDHYGRKLGFPTANIDRRSYSRKKMKVRLGIWAGQVHVHQGPATKDKEYTGAIVIGPIDKRGLPKIEVHIIGFSGGLYGKRITIILQKYLRSFKKYQNTGNLKKQIQKDIVKINIFYSRRRPE